MLRYCVTIIIKVLFSSSLLYLYFRDLASISWYNFKAVGKTSLQISPVLFLELKKNSRVTASWLFINLYLATVMIFPFTMFSTPAAILESMCDAATRIIYTTYSKPDKDVGTYTVRCTRVFSSCR